jgi:hypothetical protein
MLSELNSMLILVAGADHEVRVPFMVHRPSFSCASDHFILKLWTTLAGSLNGRGQCPEPKPDQNHQAL